MKTVVLEVGSLDDSLAALTKGWNTGKAQREARIRFATPELLWQVLTAKRWALLRALCGAGVISIREAARRAGRDVKPVHADVTALIKAGVLRRTDGGIEFPFDAVRVNFTVRAVA